MAGAKGGGRPKLAAMLREAVANRSFDGSPYFYWRLIEEALPGTAGDVLQKALVGFYPELPAALAWLGGAGH
jgi:hypothetical protein